MPKKVRVTRAQVEQAKANVAASRRLGRQPSPAMLRIANAKPPGQSSQARARTPA